MPQSVVVRQGQSIIELAFDNGFSVSALWNDSANAALKQQRKDPNVLLPGDTVVIPDLDTSTVSKATDARHRFQRVDVPAKLQLRLLKNDTPRASIPYSLQIRGADLIKGTTDGDGWVRESIPPDASFALLTLQPPKGLPEEYRLRLSCLDPADTITGAKARLSNLGFYTGDITTDPDDDYLDALKSFQAFTKLSISGELDQATINQLKTSHKS